MSTLRHHHWSAYATALALSFFALLSWPAAADSLWTGAYVGAQGGISRADLSTEQFGNFDTTRAAFGGHIGYNLGLGMVVVGVEADATYAHSSIGFATSGGDVTVDSNWNGSLRGRGGVSLGPVLLYATAGWGWTGISTIERTVAGTSLKSSGTRDGVVYGLGAETYVLPPLSLRLEVVRHDYGTDRVSIAGGITSLNSFDRADTIVRAGVTLHFK